MCRRSKLHQIIQTSKRNKLQSAAIIIQFYKAIETCDFIIKIKKNVCVPYKISFITYNLKISKRNNKKINNIFKFDGLKIA